MWQFILKYLMLNHLMRGLGVLTVGIALSGCNTLRGFGKDVERGGERVQDAATSTQNRM
jgi:predicted small secreted protein